jgi:hypothetical protein
MKPYGGRRRFLRERDAAPARKAARA